MGISNIGTACVNLSAYVAGVTSRDLQVLSEGWIDPGNCDALQCLLEQPKSLLEAVARQCTGDLEPLLADVLPATLHAAALQSRCTAAGANRQHASRGNALRFRINRFCAGAPFAAALPHVAQLASLTIVAESEASAQDSAAVARAVGRTAAVVRYCLHA